MAIIDFNHIQNVSKNPLDYVTITELLELGLTENDILQAYQPSAGGVYHARGAEGLGKTLWGAHFYRGLVDSGLILPENSKGNLTFKGKYGYGYETLKSDDLRQFLWDMTHKPYTNTFVFIDEIDSEFPARSFTDVEQTEIALRLWHISKLHNYVVMTSHKGNSTDVIMHLASHYYVFPEIPDFSTNTLGYTIASAIYEETTEGEAYDIIKTMLIYNRRELTESTDRDKPRPIKKKRKKRDIIDDVYENENLDLDFDLEYERGLSL